MRGIRPRAPACHRARQQHLRRHDDAGHPVAGRGATAPRAAQVRLRGGARSRGASRGRALAGDAGRTGGGQQPAAVLGRYAGVPAVLAQRGPGRAVRRTAAGHRDHPGAHRGLRATRRAAAPSSTRPRTAGGGWLGSAAWSRRRSSSTRNGRPGVQSLTLAVPPAAGSPLGDTLAACVAWLNGADRDWPDSIPVAETVDAGLLARRLRMAAVWAGPAGLGAYRAGDGAASVAVELAGEHATLTLTLVVDPAARRAPPSRRTAVKEDPHGRRVVLGKSTRFDPRSWMRKRAPRPVRSIRREWPSGTRSEPGPPARCDLDHTAAARK